MIQQSWVLQVSILRPGIPQNLSGPFIRSLIVD